MKLIKCIAFIIIIISSHEVLAYRQPLHIAMSEFAGTQSIVGRDELWIDWQLNKNSSWPYKKTLTYISTYPKDLNAIALLGYGADAEDTDEGYPDSLIETRAFSHFFNPQANLKLALTPAITNYKSPDWALEGSSGSSQVDIPVQQFSYGDAQFYFFLAFTDTNVTTRAFYLGAMFQTLGHVMHHVQDMAQPEHTRLDTHCDDPRCMDIYSATGNDDSSVYEELTDELLKCGAFTAVPADNTFLECKGLRSWDGGWYAKKIYLGGYPVPILPNSASTTPRDFWATPDFKGLADFSSRNFISTDTPYKIAAQLAPPDHSTVLDVRRLLPASLDLPFPSGTTNLTSSYDVRLADLLPADKLGKLAQYSEYKMGFIGVQATDNRLQTNINISRMASLSVFTERLNKLGDITGIPTAPIITENNFNLEERAKILVPMAVGYSTGLLNYFFRYRFKIIEVPIAGQRSTWKIQNLSSYDFNGCFKFYYDVAWKGRHDVAPSLGCRDVSIPAGATISTGTIALESSDIPTSTFYAVALERTGILGNTARPYLAVAATAFTYNYNPQPLETCGKDFTNSGGFERVVSEISLGETKGNVTVTYDMYTIPDSIYIEKADGSSLYSSGLVPVSGKKTINIAYDPTTFPQHKIKIIMIGKSEGTQWMFNASCPK